jgi:hypothetical protein
VTKENDGRYEFNQNRLKAHIEMSQWNPPVQLVYANKVF